MGFGALSGYKTYIVAGIAVITAISLYLTGDATLVQTIQLVVPAILGATIRHGVTAEATKS